MNIFLWTPYSVTSMTRIAESSVLTLSVPFETTMWDVEQIRNHEASKVFNRFIQIFCSRPSRLGAKGFDPCLLWPWSVAGYNTFCFMYGICSSLKLLPWSDPQTYESHIVSSICSHFFPGDLFGTFWQVLWQVKSLLAFWSGIFGAHLMADSYFGPGSLGLRKLRRSEVTMPAIMAIWCHRKWLKSTIRTRIN